MSFTTKRGFTFGATYRLNGSDEGELLYQHAHYVAFWKQRRGVVIASQVYHWYHMHVVKVPGFRWLDRRSHAVRDGELVIPLSARQDIRCATLEHRKRTILVTINVTEVEYEKLAGRPCEDITNGTP